MGTTATAAAARTEGSPPQGKPTRRPPSQAEQKRREAWGATYGPLVGKSIRDYIAAQEG